MVHLKRVDFTMNILTNAINQILLLRRNLLYRLALYLWISTFLFRFLISIVNYHIPIYQHTIHDHIFEILLDFSPFYEVNICMLEMTSFIGYLTYLIIDSSNIHLWDQIVHQLAKQNWTDFVKANLTFEPTFRFSILMQKPMKTISEWKEVYQKLQNPDSICFESRINSFPYLDRKIRARTLLELIYLFFMLETFLMLTSKCHKLYSKVILK